MPISIVPRKPCESVRIFPDFFWTMLHSPENLNDVGTGSLKFYFNFLFLMPAWLQAGIRPTMSAEEIGSETDGEDPIGGM